MSSKVQALQHGQAILTRVADLMDDLNSEDPKLAASAAASLSNLYRVVLADTAGEKHLDASGAIGLRRAIQSALRSAPHIDHTATAAVRSHVADAIFFAGFLGETCRVAWARLRTMADRASPEDAVTLASIRPQYVSAVEGVVTIWSDGDPQRARAWLDSFPQDVDREVVECARASIAGGIPELEQKLSAVSDEVILRAARSSQRGRGAPRGPRGADRPSKVNDLSAVLTALGIPSSEETVRKARARPRPRQRNNS